MRTSRSYGRWPLFSLTLAALIGGSGAALAGPALPSGGHVASGKATIGKSGGVLTVDQSSNRAIIDWTSFSIGQGGKVVIDNGSGATLNEVTGGSAAKIEGELTGTGSIYVIDPHGVIIGKSGVVNIGRSFAASTLGVSDDQFLGGGALAFAGDSTAGVINLGRIGSLGGDVALIGARVINGGTIDAAHGDVGLAAGYGVVLHDAQLNQGRFDVVLGGAGTLAANKGTISAAQAELRANGGNIYALAGNVGGVIDATGVDARDGKVFLTAGAGAVEIGGAISAQAANGVGGTIVATGERLHVLGAANLSATGTAGGRILLGGDLHGGSDPGADFVGFGVADARRTQIDAGANIAANGTAGTGGDVVVWSTTATGFQGDLSAVGTDHGGFAEVSSHRLLGFTGHADLLAASPGDTGTLLLDPENVTISTAASSGETLGGGTYSPGQPDSVLNVTDLQTALASANVIVSTGTAGGENGDITVAAPVTWSAHTLTLDAAHSIYVQSPMQALGTASLTLTTGAGGNYIFDGGDVTFAHTEQKLTINNISYTLLRTIGGLQGISAHPGGNYALAAEVNAGNASWTPLTLSGRFEGLGNAVSGLTISGSPTDSVAFFASTTSTSTIRDFGLVNETVNVTQYCYSSCTTGDAAGMVGSNGGTILNSWVTGSIIGFDNVGGLVGQNTITGSVAGSYTAGTVRGYGNVGGLVGVSAGSVTNDYSFASISTYYGGGGAFGGLVGTNEGTINEAYSVGGVTGYAQVGGLVGHNTGSINGGVWDTETSGQPIGVGVNSNSSAPQGLTTQQLQNVLPAGFGQTAWATGQGLFPYLSWQFAATPQAISGHIWSSGGGSLQGQTVQVLVQGANDLIFALPSTANGYYYDLLSPGSIQQAGSAVIAYVAAGSNSAARAEELITSASDFDLVQSLLIGPTTAATYLNASQTSLQAQDQTLLASATGSNTTAGSVVTSLSDYGYITAGSSFLFDGAVSQSTPLYIETTAANAKINVASTVSLGNAGLILVATGEVDFNAAVSASVIGVFAGGPINQSSSGGLTGALTGSAGGAVTLRSAVNDINALGAFSAPTLIVTTATSLNINGPLTVTGCCTTLTTTGSNTNIIVDAPITDIGHTVDLTAVGEIYQYASAGPITTTKLEGASGSGAYFYGQNDITDLGIFTGPSLYVLDATTMTVTGALNMNGCCVTLATTGAGSDLIIDAPVTNTSTVNLFSGGNISQSSAGIITAPTLNGSSVGATTLTQANAYGALSGFSASALTLSDSKSLVITGGVSVTGGDIGLTITGSGNGLTINSHLTDSGVITFNTPGAITQNANGIITALEITGTAGGAVTLRDNNFINQLGAFNAPTLVVTDATTLTVVGALNVTGCCTTLTTTGIGDNLIIAAAISNPGHTIDLTSGGTITEAAGGALSATKLEGMSQGAVTLTGSVSILGPFPVTAGSLTYSNNGSFTVTGAIDTGSYAMTLQTLHAGNSITIDAALDGGTVDLLSYGGVTQSSAGVITATKLIGTVSGGAVDLSTASNDITAVDAFKTNNDAFLLTDATALSVTGTGLNTSGAAITLTTTGSTSDGIAIHGEIDTRGTLTLDSAGLAKEFAPGFIIAGTLNVTAQTGISLTSTNNQITKIGTDTTATGSNHITQ